MNIPASTGPFGAERDRTVGLDNANVALSQLSYSPLGDFEYTSGHFDFQEAISESVRGCVRQAPARFG